MLRNKFFGFLATCATTRAAWALLAVAVALTAAGGFLIPRLPILTTREGMVDSRLPVQKRYVEFTQDFGAQNQLVILLEGDPEATRAAAADLAQALEQDPKWVKNVFFKIDLEKLKTSGLYYLPLDALRKLDAGLRDYEPTLRQLFAQGSWTGLLGAAETEAAKLSMKAMTDKQAVADGFEAVDRLFAQWQRFLETPEKASLDLGEATYGEMAARFSDAHTDAQGFLIGDGGRIKILFVQQSQSIDNTEFIVPFMRYCRDTAARTLATHQGVTAGFTGWPVSIEEEIGLIKGDLTRVSILATVVIFLLVLASFRSLHRTLLMFVPVALSIVWNFGVTYFTVGHLNYLTSAFVGILFGLGIDYGVVFIRRFDEETAAGRDAAEATRQTLLAVGPSVANGATTTIAAFFAIGFTDQPAFSELGIVAGTGIICAILATFFVVPALMANFPPKLQPGQLERLSESKLLRRAGGRLLGFPKAVAGFLLLAVLLAATQLPRLKFDYNLNNLLASNSEAVRVGEQLEKSTPYKTQYICVVADTLDQVRRLQKLIEAKPTVARVESIAALLPADQDEKRQVFADLAGIVNGIPLKQPDRAPDLPALRAKLEALTKRVETGQEDAFAAGLKDMVAQLDKVLSRLDAIRKDLDGPDAGRRQAAFETAFFQAAAQGKDEFARMLAAPPVTLDGLDPSMKERFFGKSGRMSVVVFPKQDIWNLAFLDSFIADVEQAAGEVFGPPDAPGRLTGFGVVYKTTTRLIHGGFIQASWLAAVMVFLLVLIDFRKVRDVLLTVVPLSTAIVVSLGLLTAFGKQLNMANQLYLPILLGIGIDYGILMTHRWLEPDGFDLPKIVATMGNALWLAAGTAIAGFGSLLFAHHRGMISFGGVLVVAVSITMLTATFGLPAVIKALKLDKRA